MQCSKIFHCWPFGHFDYLQHCMSVVDQFSNEGGISHHLSVLQGMKLLAAVGSFYLSSHVPQFFVLYSLHFMQGSGQIDGEILKTLWKEFNKVSPSTKPMSAAHRREVCDDFMRDSN